MGALVNVEKAIKGKLADNDTHTDRIEIFSETSDRIYIMAISRRTGKLECSCPGWIYRGRNCKHVKAIGPLLAEGDKEVKQLKKGKRA